MRNACFITAILCMAALLQSTTARDLTVGDKRGQLGELLRGLLSDLDQGSDKQVSQTGRERGVAKDFEEKKLSDLLSDTKQARFKIPDVVIEQADKNKDKVQNLITDKLVNKVSSLFGSRAVDRVPLVRILDNAVAKKELTDERADLEAEETKQQALEAERIVRAYLEAEEAKQQALEAERISRADLEAEETKQQALEAERIVRADLEAKKTKQQALEAERIVRGAFGSDDYMTPIKREEEPAKVSSDTKKELNDLLKEVKYLSDLEADLKAEETKQQAVEAERISRADLEAEETKQQALEAERISRADLEAEETKQQALEAERIVRADLEAKKTNQQALEAERIVRGAFGSNDYMKPIKREEEPAKVSDGDAKRELDDLLEEVRSNLELDNIQRLLEQLVDADD